MSNCECPACSVEVTLLPLLDHCLQICRCCPVSILRAARLIELQLPWVDPGCGISSLTPYRNGRETWLGPTGHWETLDNQAGSICKDGGFCILQIPLPLSLADLGVVRGRAPAVNPAPSVSAAPSRQGLWGVVVQGDRLGQG